MQKKRIYSIKSKKIKNKRKIFLYLFFVLNNLISVSLLSGLEIFKGFDPVFKPKYTVASLLKSQYKRRPFWTETYFHEAQFPQNGITVFTHITISEFFGFESGCKFNVIITFPDQKKYVFQKDYSFKEFILKKDPFYLKCSANYLKLKDNNYKVHLENDDIDLTLNYEIVNPPYRFGDGIVKLDIWNFLSYSQPVSGAHITGYIKFKEKEYNLKGRGSINHDYHKIEPLKQPRYWRSFWLYNDEYSVNIDTTIMPYSNKQIDRLVIFRNKKYFSAKINYGLKCENYQSDSKNNFQYPTNFIFNFTDYTGKKITAKIQHKEFTDKIKMFDYLTPFLAKIVRFFVKDLWVYRFWAKAEFEILLTDGTKEVLSLYGLGNYVHSEN